MILAFKIWLGLVFIMFFANILVGTLTAHHPTPTIQKKMVRAGAYRAEIKRRMAA